MANELEKMLAGILKPKTPDITNDVVDRYQGMSDEISVADSLAASGTLINSRVGYARVGYSETGSLTWAYLGRGMRVAFTP